MLPGKESTLTAAMRVFIYVEDDHTATYEPNSGDPKVHPASQHPPRHHQPSLLAHLGKSQGADFCTQAVAHHIKRIRLCNAGEHDVPSSSSNSPNADEVGMQATRPFPEKSLHHCIS